MLDLFDHILAEGFVGDNLHDLYSVATSVDDIMCQLDESQCAIGPAATELM